MTKGIIATIATFLLFYVSNNDAFTSPLTYPFQGNPQSLSSEKYVFQSRRVDMHNTMLTAKKTNFELYSTAAEDQSATKTIPIILNGQNIELTPALEEYVNKRIGGILKKLATSNSVGECDVVMSVNKNPKVKDAHRVEVVMNVKGTTIICKNTSPDMYESIDAAASALGRKLSKYKERRVAGYHGGANMGEELRVALEAIDAMDNTDTDTIAATKAANDAEYDDPYKKEVVKINSFQLDKPISIDEAIFALDYVDHDFYVFTNEGTGKINVVYKRHTGGVGLVEP